MDQPHWFFMSVGKAHGGLLGDLEDPAKHIKKNSILVAYGTVELYGWVGSLWQKNVKREVGLRHQGPPRHPYGQGGI
jgi:hypothetical protein